MTNYRMTAILLIMSLACLVPRARADEWHKTTRVTVKQPIRVQGTVLTPGTYTLRLVSPDINIVQIWSAHQRRLYASIMAIPDERLEPAGHTVLKFTESRKGTLPELHAWFYPGDTEGEEFVYPHSPAEVISKTQPKNVKPVG